MEIVYEYNFGMENNGKIELLLNGKYQCSETPMFGGDWMKVGEEYDNLDDAIEYLKSLI